MTHQSGRTLRKRDIRPILEEITGWGSFSQTVTLPDGRTVTHRFALATGMGMTHYEGHYCRHFGEDPPPWATLEHPYHQFCLYQLALAQNRLLPLHRPLTTGEEA